MTARFPGQDAPFVIVHEVDNERTANKVGVLKHTQTHTERDRKGLQNPLATTLTG